MSGKLEGRTAIITGATSGLGQAIAKRFHEEGGESVTFCRIGTAIKATYVKYAVEMDLTRPADGKLFMAEIKSAGFVGEPSVLVNCAGIYGPIGPAGNNDWDDWVETLNINLLMSVIMCRAVLPLMRSCGYGKIIQISGGGATKPMPGYSAYAASKAAVVRFAETLAEELRGTGIDVNSLAPGALNTRLKDQALAAGADPDVYKDADLNMEKACDLAVFLASAESDGITGKLISAVWDDWRQPHFQEVCRNHQEYPDFCTLRRHLSTGSSELPFWMRML
jgi:NAD(P)-dependent dehydrogenase (short-subunit alcohol dehydrogenase family)